MVSRRRIVALLGSVAGLAGCTETPTEPRTPTRTDPVSEESPQTDLPNWEPAWSLSVEGTPLGVSAEGPAGAPEPSDDSPLYVTSETDGETTITAVDPATATAVWETTLDGSAVSYSYATTQGIARGGWGVTVTGEAVYAVAGRPDERGPTAIHALDPTTGETLWRFDSDRELGVAGVTDGLLVARGREYVAGTGTPPPTGATETEPSSTLLYGLDPATGTLRWQREVFDHRETVVTADGVFAATAAGLQTVTPDGTQQTTVHSSATAVAAVGRRVVALVDSGQPTLCGLDATGEPEWRRSLPVDELLTDGTRLYAGGDVAAAVEPDGSLAWRDEAHAQWLLLDPDRDTLYTRSGVAADGATAYATDGTRRWRFAPPSNNAWPEAATGEAVAVSAITGETASEPFLTTYAVGPDGRARRSRGFDTLFDALGRDGTVYVAAAAGFLALDL